MNRREGEGESDEREEEERGMGGELVVKEGLGARLWRPDQIRGDPRLQLNLMKTSDLGIHSVGEDAVDRR